MAKYPQFTGWIGSTSAATGHTITEVTNKVAVILTSTSWRAHEGDRTYTIRITKGARQSTVFTYQASSGPPSGPSLGD